MITISQSQALQRWDTLPRELREALYSEQFSAIVWQACKNAHLSEEKTRVVAGIVGYVFLGFLHPEDIGAELRERLQIDGRLAATLADEFSKKIFASYGTILSGLYAPSAQEKPSMLAPKLIDIAPAKPKENEAPKELAVAPKLVPEIKKGPLAPEPKPLPAPVININIGTGVGHPAEHAPAPFILHEETAITPVKKPEEFRFVLGKEFFEKTQVLPKPPPPPPPRMARIELGTAPKKEQKIVSPVARTSQPTGRIVHYSDLRTPLEKETNASAIPQYMPGIKNKEAAPAPISRTPSLSQKPPPLPKPLPSILPARPAAKPIYPAKTPPPASGLSGQLTNPVSTEKSRTEKIAVPRINPAREFRHGAESPTPKFPAMGQTPYRAGSDLRISRDTPPVATEKKQQASPSVPSPYVPPFSIKPEAGTTIPSIPLKTKTDAIGKITEEQKTIRAFDDFPVNKKPEKQSGPFDAVPDTIVSGNQKASAPENKEPKAVNYTAEDK